MILRRDLLLNAFKFSLTAERGSNRKKSHVEGKEPAKVWVSLHCKNEKLYLMLEETKNDFGEYHAIRYCMATIVNSVCEKKTPY